MKLIIFILIVLIIAALLIRIILRSVNQHSPLLMQLHAAGMHLPPQAAGPDRSHFSYNTQKQPPEKPRSSAEPKPQSPSLITEKRPRPGPKGRNRVAFNYECCNYIFIAVSLLAGSSQYTLVSGP
ncbi:TPA: hypothetical protein ACWJ7Z_004323, partial [Escherichia coli]